MEDWAKGLEWLSKGFELTSENLGGISQLKEKAAIFWLDILSKILYLLAATGSFYLIIRRFLRRKMLEILADPVAFWNNKPERKRRKQYQRQMKGSRIPTIAIADFKGGTGKSMIAANLAACLDEQGARVLLLDLGHNTTLSQMMPMDSKAQGFPYNAHHVLAGKDSYYPPVKLKGSFRHSYIYAAMGDLGKEDAKLAFYRLIGTKKRDIRFHVHDYLSKDSIQKQFDIVIIDMPAQLSTAVANALCACTHVLVPTILDRATLPKTIDTLKTVQAFRKALRLNFRFLGVLPSIVASSKKLGTGERQAFRWLKGELQREFADLLVPHTKKREVLDALNIWIASRVGLRHEPGDDLPYFKSTDTALRAMFDNLRRTIDDQLLGQDFKLPYLDEQAKRAAAAIAATAVAAQNQPVASTLPQSPPMASKIAPQPVTEQPEEPPASTIEAEIEAVKQAMLAPVIEQKQAS